MYNLDFSSHNNHLRVVFELLHSNELWVNSKECKFGVKHLEYLGHIISAGGVLADQRLQQGRVGQSLRISKAEGDS